MIDDLTNRLGDTKWPKEFDPSQAKIFSHTEILIHAAPEKIWQHLVDVTKWPEWYPDAKAISTTDQAGTLHAGTTFAWTTFGLEIGSEVHTFKPHDQISWFAYMPGEAPSFYHVWRLLPQADDVCLVVSEEVGLGSVGSYMRETDEGLMHRGHDMWLATLRWVAEDTH